MVIVTILLSNPIFMAIVSILVIVTILAIENVMAIVIVLAIKTVMAIVIVLAIKTNIHGYHNCISH